MVSVVSGALNRARPLSVICATIVVSMRSGADCPSLLTIENFALLGRSLSTMCAIESGTLTLTRVELESCAASGADTAVKIRLKTATDLGNTYSETRDMNALRRMFCLVSGQPPGGRSQNLGRLRMSGTPSDSVLVDVRKLFLERRDLRKVVDHDVGLIRMLLEVALVILLGAVKSTELRNLRYDRARK